MIGGNKARQSSYHFSRQPIIMSSPPPLLPLRSHLVLLGLIERLQPVRALVHGLQQLGCVAEAVRLEQLLNLEGGDTVSIRTKIQAHKALMKHLMSDCNYSRQLRWENGPFLACTLTALSLSLRSWCSVVSNWSKAAEQTGEGDFLQPASAHQRCCAWTVHTHTHLERSGVRAHMALSGTQLLPGTGQRLECSANRCGTAAS